MLPSGSTSPEERVATYLQKSVSTTLTQNPPTNRESSAAPKKKRGPKPGSRSKISFPKDGMSIGMVPAQGPMWTPSGDPWPGSDPPPKGRVRYGGTGDSREGLWDDPEIRHAAARYAASDEPMPVFVPEMGDSAKQYDALVKLIFESRDAMAWLQNSKLTGSDQSLSQFCQKYVHAPRGHGSFITGSVANSLPHIGDAMAAANPLWGLPHATASVAMSRRYDRTQKLFILQSLRRAYQEIAYPKQMSGGSSGGGEHLQANSPQTKTGLSALEIYGLIGTTLQSLHEKPKSPSQASMKKQLSHAAENCVIACNSLFESLLLHCGGG